MSGKASESNAEQVDFQVHIQPRRKSVDPESAAFAPKDPESVEHSPHVPAALGRRRGSFRGVSEEREAIRRASFDAASREWKGSNDQLRTLLGKYTVADLKLSPKVVELEAATDPVDAFEVLLKANILSAPVWDKETKQYIGFLDVRDLVSSALHASQKQIAKDSFLTVAVAVDAHTGRAPSLKYLAKRNPFRPVKKSSTLLEVAQMLKERKTHRVPVVDDGKCTGIVSQSTFIKFIADHREAVGDDLAQTLEAIKLGFKQVLTVDESKTARDAFTVIEKAGLSGIGVVDEDGKMIGNTSARDIKYFVLNKGELSLEEPVMDYLAAIRQKVVSDKDRAPISTVRKTDSLGRVVGLLAATKYHRLFIVDSDGKPTGVVAISDILAYAVRDPPKKE